MREALDLCLLSGSCVGEPLLEGQCRLAFRMFEALEEAVRLNSLYND